MKEVEAKDINQLKIENIFFVNNYKSDFEDCTLKGLRESLIKIGNGEIVEKDFVSKPGDTLMYKEYLDNGSKFLIVHATRSTTFGVMYYKYEITIYLDDPQRYQIGGGFGTSGLDVIRHTVLAGGGDLLITRDPNIVSETCKEVKTYFN